jgi:PRC-barrel domain
VDITEHSERWVGRTAFDADATRLGKIEAIYHDDVTGQPEWAAVKVGSVERLVPLAGATRHRPIDELDDDDDDDTPEDEREEDLRLAFTTEVVAAAPHFELDDEGHLSAADEQTLYSHYGRPWSAPQSGPLTPRLRRYGRIGDTYA